MTQAKMTKRFDARFDEKTVSKLERLSKVSGLTKSEVVRWLILHSDQVANGAIKKTLLTK